MEMLQAVYSSSYSNGTVYTLLSFLHNAGAVITVIALCYSLLQCYFGYTLFRINLVIQGVLTGIVSGAVVGFLLASASGNISGAGTAIILGTAVIFGILGGVLAHVLHGLGVFIYFLSTFGVIAAAIAFLSHPSFSNPEPLILGIVVGVIAGILGVVLEKHIVILTTGICYGFAAGFIISGFDNVTLGTLLGFVFAVSGVVLQTVRLKRKKKNEASTQVQQTMINNPGMPIQPSVTQHYCSGCGAVIQHDAAFCPCCGKATTVQQTAVEVKQSMPTETPAPSYSELQETENTDSSVDPVDAEEQTLPEEQVVSEPKAAENNVKALFCSSCGARIDNEQSIFCSVCGNKLQ